MPIQSRDHQLWLLWGKGSLTLAEAPLLVEVICDTKLLRWRFRRFMLVNPLCSISCGSRRCRQLFCFQEAVVSSESSQAKLLNALRGRERLAHQASAITAPESWPLKIHNSVFFAVNPTTKTSSLASILNPSVLSLFGFASCLITPSSEEFQQWDKALQISLVPNGFLSSLSRGRG
jgi:hypothetical protein